MAFVRSANPIWYFVDLVGEQLDDSYYMFTLQNTIPYLPQDVYHDYSGNVVWSNPIQFLSNGTLPDDIYFDSSLVYRLEIRAGNSQSDALVYEIENYVPGSGIVNDGLENQIAYYPADGAALSGFGPLNDGYTVLGATGLAPQSALITGSGGIVITPGAHTLNIGFGFTSAFSLVIRVLTVTGTYTPTTNMAYCIVQAIGGGGGGGGATSGGAGQTGCGGGGGGGGYSCKAFAAVTIGASQAFTIGAAGTSGVSGGGDGGTGGNTTFGAFLTSNGGAGGAHFNGNGSNGTAVGGAGGSGTGGDINQTGQAGNLGFAIAGEIAIGGDGGCSPTFNGAGSNVSNNGVSGKTATGYGCGGGGATPNDGSSNAGGAGAAGVIIITEYVYAA